MKKISIFKRIFTIVGVFIFSIWTRVFAYDANYFVPDYGVVDPGVTPVDLIKDFIFPLVRIIILPLVLLIGLVIYTKKCKDEHRKKVIKGLIIVLTIVCVVLIIYELQKLFL